MKRLILLVIMGFFSWSLFAQRTVEGTITDAKTGETLIGAAGIDDHARARPVDIGDGLVFALVGAARDRRLALAHNGRGEQTLLLSVEGDRHAAHRDIEIVGFKVLHQFRPGSVDILDLDPERLAQCLRHIDVEPPEFRCFLVQRTERQIIAGQTDAQRAALNNLVEPGDLLGMRRGRHQ